MKWTLKLVTESDSGKTNVREVACWERTDAFVKPASLARKASTGRFEWYLEVQR